MLCLTILFTVEPERFAAALPDTVVTPLRVAVPRWPAEGEEATAIWKRQRMEMECEWSDGGDEMIRSSGEPS